MGSPARVGRDWPVAELRVEIARARARITGKLMHRGEEQAGVHACNVRLQDGFGAVPVVRVEIPHGDALKAAFGSRRQRCDGDLVEVTKTHRCVSGGMMTRRT